MSLALSLRLLCKQPDHRLLALAAEGHQRAFEALAQRYRPALLAYCRHLGFARTAEDVLQQAFMDAWVALQRGTAVRDCQAWLYRIVHNSALRQHQRFGEIHAPLGEALATTTAADATVELRLEAREALASVAALPSPQREALVQTVLDGRSNDQVAARLGVSGAAIRGLVYRARSTLRAAPRVFVPPAPLAWLLRHRHLPSGAGQRVPDAVIAGGPFGDVGTGAGGVAVSAAILKVNAVVATTGALFVGALAIHHRHHHPVSRSGAQRASVAVVRPRPLTVGASSGHPAAARIGTSDAENQPASLHTVAARSGVVATGTHRSATRDPAGGFRPRTGSGPSASAPRATRPVLAPPPPDGASGGADSPAPAASPDGTNPGTGSGVDAGDAPADATPAGGSAAGQSAAVQPGADESSATGSGAAD